MQVKDVMTTSVETCSPDATVSEVINIMQKRKIHQVPLLSPGDKLHKKGSVLGLVTINKIIVREFDPTSAKARSVMTSTATISPNEPLERAVELMLDANMRALPVVEHGKLVGIVSEQDLLPAIKLSGEVGSLAKPLISVDPKVSVSKIKEAMVYHNISRVVVGKGNNILGCVGTVDMLNLLQPGWTSYPSKAGRSSEGVKHTGSTTRGSRGRGYVEKARADNMPLVNLVHEVQRIPEANKAQDALELLKENEELLVERISGDFGIVTPKDAMRAWLKVRERALIVIEGLDRNDDAVDIAKIQQKASQIVRALAKSCELQSLKIRIKKYRKQGHKTKYSIKVELPTSIGTFQATREHGKDDKSYGQLVTIVQRALDDLQRQVRKRQDKFRRPDQMDLSLARAAKEEGIGFRGKRRKGGR